MVKYLIISLIYVRFKLFFKLLLIKIKILLYLLCNLVKKKLKYNKPTSSIQRFSLEKKITTSHLKKINQNYHKIIFLYFQTYTDYSTI